MGSLHARASARSELIRLPHLGPGSTIINSTSVQGYNPSPMIISYASTKFAIIGFTKVLAQDLAPRGIRVNAVAPGPVWTPLQVSDGQPTEKLNGFGDRSWLGRTSQPVEQAPAYVFLASRGGRGSHHLATSPLPRCRHMQSGPIRRDTQSHVTLQHPAQTNTVARLQGHRCIASTRG